MNKYIKEVKVQEALLNWNERTRKSAKKEAVEECIKKIDDYGDKLVREGAEEQSDYYMGELNAVSRIKEILFVGGGKKWLCGKCENDKLPKHSRHCDKS